MPLDSELSLFNAPAARSGGGVYPPSVDVARAARLSEDGRYRYVLGRRWGDGLPATFVMLNPSTADAELDDPTIRRCVGFARTIGADGIHVLNLYAFRATKPEDLWKADDPVGPENDEYLARHAAAAARQCRPIIAAWGANARPARVAQVLALPGMRTALHAFGVTKHGQPRHPLYLPASARPQPWEGRP
ncbi:DUF1643 domain-containing protein [Nocardioides sp.]|uniref:DUF1643 domain-containing protein n=1 Tax=Nocardioides sp. TaxID=35761 RepID=UPI0026159E32|nr:DUF1643 domain-containing protein [Nocardioides sp.]MDI6911503.1 DUF1643 domain-containing protein [Nocardioides sp.]